MIFMAMTKKKSHPKFNVPNFGSPYRRRVKERWRKQRGIDSKKRVKKAWAGAEPTIGYRNPEEIRGLRVNGKRNVLIFNAGQLKEAMANADLGEFDITLAGALSKRKRMELITIAKQNKIHVTNGAL